MSTDKSKPNPLFADWYRVAKVDLSDAEILVRWSSTQKLIAQTQVSDIAMLVRLAHERLQGDSPFVEKVRTVYKEDDGTFPMRGNDFELAVLSAIVLNQLFAQDSSHLADAAALSVRSAAFLGWKPVLADVRELSNRYLVDESSDVRDIPKPPEAQVSATGLKTVADLVNNQATQTPSSYLAITAMNDLLKAITAGFASTRQAFKEFREYSVRTQTILTEELETLWWFLGEASADLEKPWSQVSAAAQPILMGKELADRTLYLPGLRAAREFLDKSLRLSGSSTRETSLVEAVNAVPSKWRGALPTNGLDPNTGPLLPVRLALARSLEVDGPEDWVPLVTKATGFDPRKRESVLSLAWQTYTELLLMRAYNQPAG